MIGCQRTEDLGLYLGVPLLHRRISRSTFQFIVDKVRDRLNGFDAKLLSMAGRMTLSKYVLLAIPSYFMQAVMVPVGIFEKIEQLVRQFMWGSMGGGRKATLVRWDTCCQPLAQGGLGLRQLVPQNFSCLMKLAFNFVTKGSALWVSVLWHKDKVFEMCPVSIARTKCSFLWPSLMKVWSDFRDGIFWSIGNGRSVGLLRDVWLRRWECC